MSRRLTILIFICLLSGSRLLAQFHNDSLYNLVGMQKLSLLKTNPIAIFQGPIILTAEYRLCWEQGIAKNQTIQLSGSYLGKNFYLAILESNSSPSIKFAVNGYRFQFEYRIYGKDNHQYKNGGIYMAPAFSYSSVKITDRYYKPWDEYLMATYINYTLRVGYQYFNDKLALDCFAGAGYRDNSWIEHFNQASSPINSDELSIYPGHFKFILGFNIGYKLR